MPLSSRAWLPAAGAQHIVVMHRGTKLRNGGGLAAVVVVRRAAHLGVPRVAPARMKLPVSRTQDQVLGERPTGLGTGSIPPARGASAASESSRANGLGDATPPSGAEPGGDDVEP